METLLSIGVVVIIIGLVVPAYIQIGNQQRVSTGADRLEQIFSQAKDNAQSGKKDCTACACNTAGELPLIGWRVNVTNGGGTYTVEGVCSATDYPGGAPVFFYSHTENFPAGVKAVLSPVPAFPVMFRTGGQGIYPPLSGSNVIKVTVSGASGTTAKTFTINGAGGIQ